ncbi:hypothetical protein HDU96_005193 [Phlyctochytrium bullatum]|nr:hypothetical protein HDU96_005193 [Phlyctochytrium bullatum]
MSTSDQLKAGYPQVDKGAILTTSMSALSSNTAFDDKASASISVGGSKVNEKQAMTGSTRPVGANSPQGFWSTLVGLLVYLVINRLPAHIMLLATITLTHTAWWRNATKGVDLVLLQQIVTGIVGALIGFILRDSTWMMQGALAAAWAFRKGKGISLATAEAIQGAYPGLVFKTSSGLLEKTTVLLIPVFSIIVQFMYKFGITVDSSTVEWNGIINTKLLRAYMDSRGFAFPGCSDGPCTSKYVDEVYGLRVVNPDLVDWKMDGVEKGRSVSTTAYELNVGDVPCVHLDFRRSLADGVTYSQLFLKSSMDCGRTATNPWTLDCPETMGIFKQDSLPNVANFTVCSNYPSSTIKGVLTFDHANKSLSFDLSCRYEIAVYRRNITIVPDGFKWMIKQPTGKEEPLGGEKMWQNRFSWLHHVPATLSQRVDFSSGKPCYSWSATCKGVENVQLLMASALIRDLDEWAYQFVQGSKDPMPPEALPSLPVPDRVYLSNMGEWFNIIGPNQDMNTTLKASNLTSTAGAYASAKLVETRYVKAQPWLALFLLLFIALIICAVIKVIYQSHPLEPVAGMLWTLRKVSPDVAKKVHGMKLAEAIEYTATLRLESATGGAGVTIVADESHEMARSATFGSVQGDVTLDRDGKTVKIKPVVGRNSTLQYEPPPYATLYDFFRSPGYGAEDLAAEALKEDGFENKDAAVLVRFEQDAFISVQEQGASSTGGEILSHRLHGQANEKRDSQLFGAAGIVGPTSIIGGDMEKRALAAKAETFPRDVKAPLENNASGSSTHGGADTTLFPQDVKSEITPGTAADNGSMSSARSSLPPAIMSLDRPIPARFDSVPQRPQSAGSSSSNPNRTSGVPSNGTRVPPKRTDSRQF